MLDRTIAPAFVKSPEVKLKEAERSLINQQIPFHYITGGTQEVSKIEFVFNGGKCFEKKNGVAFFTIKMLREGTDNHHSKEISEKLDHYGAFLELISGFDFASVGVFCLNKYLPEVLPLVVELIYSPSFPEEQLELLKEIEIQHLKIDLKKNSYKAQRVFRNTIFSEKNPYGRSLQEQEIKDISKEDVILHHKQNYSDFEVFASGKFDPVELEGLLEENLPKGKHLNIGGFKGKVLDYSYNPQMIEQEVNGSLQSSIRVGFPFISKDHEDYIPFNILNHVLGGYFGSRLMKNLREDKGYTYGIYSSVVTLRLASYFNISTDVKKESSDSTIEEIKKELQKLKDDLIPLDELETIKNHLSGTFQSDITSPFSLMDKYKSLYLHNLDYSYYQKYFDVLNSIEQEQLKQLSNKYFVEEQLSIVKVG